MVIVFTFSSDRFTDVSVFWITGIWIPTLTQRKNTFSICLVCFVILIDLRWLFKEVSSKWIVPCHYDHVCILFALSMFYEGIITRRNWSFYIFIDFEFELNFLLCFGHIGWLQSLPLNRKDHLDVVALFLLFVVHFSKYKN